MTVTFVPGELKSDGSRQRPLDGSVISDKYIDKPALVSSDADNLLKTGSDGSLLVDRKDIPAASAPSASDYVSAESGNQLKVSAVDSKLFVAKPEAVNPASLVSGVSGNAVTVAADNKLYVASADVPSPADMVSSDAGNRITVGSDSKLFVASQSVTPSDLISTDVNNSLVRGSDAKLKVKVVSDDAGNLLTRGSDLGAMVKAADMISNGSAGNLITENSVDHGIEVKTSDVQTLIDASLNAKVIVSDDAGNLVTKGTDGGAFLSGADLPDAVSAGAGVAVDAGKVSVLAGHGLAVNGTTNKLYVNEDDLDFKEISLAATEKILSLSAAHELSSTLSMSYNSSTGYLTLLGTGGQAVDSIFIPGAEQALLGVEVVKNPAGYEAGTYFKYTFATAGGNVVSYVKVPEGSTTAGGNGITAVTSDGVATVSAKAGLGISVDSIGINVMPEPDRGLTVSSSGVAVKVKSGGGVVVDADGLSVDPSVVPTSASLEALTERVHAAENDIDALETGLDSTNTNLSNLKNTVDALELNASALSVSNTAVDPGTLDNSTGVLYPATDLLS